MKSAVVLCICTILLTQTVSVTTQQTSNSFFTTPINYKYPCSDTKDIIMGCEPGFFSEKMNKFFVKINMNFTSNSTVKVLFDSDIIIRFWSGNYYSGWSTMALRAGDTMEKRFLNPHASFSFILKGTTSEHPNMTSLTINGVEFCKEPIKGMFDKCLEAAEYSREDKNINKTEKRKFAKPDFQCGRRKSHDYNWVTDRTSGLSYPQDTGSVADGVANRGDWPWHVGVSVLPLNLYIRFDNKVFFEVNLCGGTLISRNFVLTARQCVWLFTMDVEPEFNIFFVILGRQSLGQLGRDARIEKVVRIITPDSNTNSCSFYSIALLKLQSEVHFTDVIRPACLWHRRENDLTNDNAVGILAGWGTTNDNMSRPLQQVNLPIVSRDICIASNRSYEKFLTEKDFCAGYLNNGTAACHDDMGGALQVFAPDNATGGMSGRWYVRGIMTRTVYEHRGICDKNNYAIFADEEKFAEWIDSYVDA